MNRAYYSNNICQFLKDDNDTILGVLVKNHKNRSLDDLQKNAWLKQIEILKKVLLGFKGTIYFEFSVPRMGKRVDNIIIIKDIVFVVEFKVGSNTYEKYAVDQVVDYTVDLKNFHEGSHNIKLVPVLLATQADVEVVFTNEVLSLSSIIKTNPSNFPYILKSFIDSSSGESIDSYKWECSRYKPTPTIIEAAQALYKGHDVKEITRSDSGAVNLSRTAESINMIIENSKKNKKKSICFVTGVPGAGKTLAGLNIANDRMRVDESEHAVFLSGNGPLVEVLRESLSRDELIRAKKNQKPITKKQAAIKPNAFIQNIHHFRDESLLSEEAPIEKVVVFDEAQRAWTKDKTSFFMQRKRGIEDFGKSEPEFLIEVMNRHKEWCVIICLVGGGQEINTGEAGLEEWLIACKEHFLSWDVFFSKEIIENSNYLQTTYIKNWLSEYGHCKDNLHLSTSIRSFRSSKVSAFVSSMLDLDLNVSKKLYREIKEDYPFLLTRNLQKAKKWLEQNAKGSERIGIIASSGARRLKSLGIDVKNEIVPSNWFLNSADDVRSSSFLEDVATEFDIQGLEIDWACVAWGANFYINNCVWNYQSFKGCKWQSIRKKIDQDYLKNAYRVLLTRARQGLIIYLPEGCMHGKDITRQLTYYDETYFYLKEIGVDEI